MTKNYEQLYSKPDLYWGSEPSELVKKFAEFAPEGKALDLGMGEGRDALYLASLGYDVTGVEATDSGVLKCEKLAQLKKLEVKAVCEDAVDFAIAKNRFAIISCINLFQFISKRDTAKIITRAVTGLKKEGLFFCSVFTVDDPSYKVRKQKTREIDSGVFLDSSGHVYSLYAYGELLKCCDGLRPIYYREFDFYDTAHGPSHWHGVAELVGKKT